MSLFIALVMLLIFLQKLVSHQNAYGILLNKLSQKILTEENDCLHFIEEY